MSPGERALSLSFHYGVRLHRLVDSAPRNQWGWDAFGFPLLVDCWAYLDISLGLMVKVEDSGRVGLGFPFSELDSNGCILV